MGVAGAGAALHVDGLLQPGFAAPTFPSLFYNLSTGAYAAGVDNVTAWNTSSTTGLVRGLD